MPEVLFVCTGNFYRSRFAEAVFNHEAVAADSPWRAFSRGLAIDQIEGDISPYAADALVERGIPRERTGPTRVALKEADLKRAGLAICLQEHEHRPLMKEQFPAWADRVTYWHVGDLWEWEAEVTLAAIERQVSELLAALNGE